MKGRDEKIISFKKRTEEDKMISSLWYPNSLIKDEDVHCDWLFIHSNFKDASKESWDEWKPRAN